MENKIFVPIILGTARVGRQSEKIAHYVYNSLKEFKDIEWQFVDVKDYINNRTVPSWEENDIATAWRDIAARAKAFIIVTPEYNNGYPGELKLLLDQALSEYNGKTVFVASVSRGAFGGVRATQALLPVFRMLGLQTHLYSLIFPMVEELNLKSREEMDKEYKKRIEELVTHIREVVK